MKALNSPAVKLMYDTEHVQVMDGDLLHDLERVAAEIGSVQIADVPGRLEPGQGEINFVQFFRKLRQVGYMGLVELENNFSRPGAEGERLAYEALCQINTQI